MNKQRGFSLPIIIGLVVLLGVIGGIIFLTSNSTKDKDNLSNVTLETEKQNSESNEVFDQTTEVGVYEEYTPDKLAQAQGTIILFFHAVWCPTCHALDADIKDSLNDIPANVIIFKTDYDIETSLRKKYKVNIQHSLVQIDTEGNLIAKWTGSPTLESLLNKIR